MFLLAGQSKTQYSNTNLSFPEDYLAPNAKVWQITQSGLLQLGADPLDHVTASESQGKIGTGVTFAADYYVPNSLAAGRRVLLVPAGANGTSFASGRWIANTGDLWLNAVRLSNLAMARSGAVFKVIDWDQGESDALTGGSAVTNYQARLDAALLGFRGSITGAANAPILVHGMSVDWIGSDPDRLAIQAILADTPNRIPRCAFVDISDLSTGGDVHLSAAQQRIVGGRDYDAWAAL